MKNASKALLVIFIFSLQGFGETSPPPKAPPGAQRPPTITPIAIPNTAAINEANPAYH